ncbi:MAG: glucuronate isomerase [Candidatus Saganbacteria bacterium]|nr:glucuronate isomerase [Candidatus Saganbacteria bacterium]
MIVGSAVLNHPADISSAIARRVRDCKVVDMHTHLFSPPFGSLNLWGIDHLMTYHYLQAEYFRTIGLQDRSQVTASAIASFNRLPIDQKADRIYKTLFVDNTPVSEACRGVLTTLSMLGQNLRQPDLTGYRKALGNKPYERHIETIFRLANIDRVVMTNDPFVDEERAVWEKGVQPDRRFMTALRVDPLFTNWTKAVQVMGVSGSHDFTGIRRFLETWADKMKPVYLAASLPPDFDYPSSGELTKTSTDNGHITEMFNNAVLPMAKERDLPVALMIGVKRGVNPILGQAGDGVGSATIEAVERLCSNTPDVRFFVTLLSDTNQRELAVAARKFPNLMPFGCWWFLNTPAEIERITTLRLELAGTTVVPQHSDARVLDQLAYKWSHSRQIIADVLTAQYLKLPKGTPLTEEDIARDVSNMLGGNFLRFCGIK